MVLILLWGDTECVSPLKHLLYPTLFQHRARKQSDTVTVPAPWGHIGLSSNSGFKANPADRAKQKAVGRGVPICLGSWRGLGEGVQNGVRGVSSIMAGIKNSCILLPAALASIPSSLPYSLETHASSDFLGKLLRLACWHHAPVYTSWEHCLI